MPLITPTDVKDYTDFESVQNRSDPKMEKDIMRAELDVFKYCGHRFDDETKYPTLPEEVKLALILLTEYYSLTSGDESMVKGYKSEKIGDYSYTLGDGTAVSKPDIDVLLADHVVESGMTGKKKMSFRMRAI
jgi:hypothetical protein